MSVYLSVDTAYGIIVTYTFGKQKMPEIIIYMFDKVTTSNAFSYTKYIILKYIKKNLYFTYLLKVNIYFRKVFYQIFYYYQ